MSMEIIIHGTCGTSIAADYFDGSCWIKCTREQQPNVTLVLSAPQACQVANCIQRWLADRPVDPRQPNIPQG